MLQLVGSSDRVVCLLGLAKAGSLGAFAALGPGGACCSAWGSAAYGATGAPSAGDGYVTIASTISAFAALHGVDGTVAAWGNNCPYGGTCTEPPTTGGYMYLAATKWHAIQNDRISMFETIVELLIILGLVRSSERTFQKIAALCMLVSEGRERVSSFSGASLLEVVNSVKRHQRTASNSSSGRTSRNTGPCRPPR